MKKILRSTSFMIIYFIIFATAENFNALLFDRFGKSLIELPDEISNEAKSGRWASACPANDKEGDPDKEFNEKHSFYGNALFIRGIYDEENLKDISKTICSQPFKLSIVMSNRKPLHYEFGFEIYVNHLDWNADNFKWSNKTKYRSLKTTLKILRDSINPQEVLDKRLFRITAGRKDEDKDFIWIPVFRVRSKNRQLKRIEYEIRENNRQPKLLCQDYNLGKEMFNDIDVDINTFYSEKAQKEALLEARYPVKTCVPKSEYKCLEKWSLIPADQFQFGTSNPPTCSNMTAIPIWSSKVKDILQKLDDYLYLLSQISGKPLRINAGVHKVLEMKTKRTELKKFILLKSEKLNLHVPKLIYKMVKFQVTNCQNEDPGCWHGIVIVIHNDPNFKEKDSICNDKSEELGWKEIKYENLSTDTEATESKHVYVCPINKTTLKKIGLKYDESLSTIRELSLKNFPTDKDATEPEDKDIRSKIFKELEQMKSPQSEPKLVQKSNKVIERPFIQYDKFSTLESVEDEKDGNYINNDKKDNDNGDNNKVESKDEKALEENADDFIYFTPKQKFHFDRYTSNYEDYASPGQVIESTKTIFSKGIYYAKQYFRIIFQAVKKAVGFGHKKLLLNENKMGLMWLYLFQLRFDLTKKILEVTWHEIQATNRWTTENNCRDYSLGSEAYEGIDVDALYVLNEPEDAYEPIHVLSGITGEHQFTNKTSLKKSTLYLDSKKNKIPVPNLIYKIVDYQLKDCKLQENRCWYSAIIVIHNDPFFKPSDKICSKDVTQAWGWDEITKDSEGNQFDEIYVCENVTRVQKKLKMDVTERVAGGLDLIKFKYSKDGRNVDVKYIKGLVDEKFEKFSKEGENFDPVNTKMVKRVPPRSNVSDDLEDDHEMSKDEEASGR
ncbi:uncharacterized protein LOC135838732 [Planococcus citri]|uniref:uncharacterized protein LOC135838732 n=1 Tax=Planococcus citri TaxID=170843 RepID=UPI0031F93AA6